MTVGRCCWTRLSLWLPLPHDPHTFNLSPSRSHTHSHTCLTYFSLFSPSPLPLLPHTPTLVQPEPQGAQTVSEVRSLLWLCCCLSLGRDGDRLIRRSHVAIDLIRCGVGTRTPHWSLFTSRVLEKPSSCVCVCVCLHVAVTLPSSLSSSTAVLCSDLSAPVVPLPPSC